MATWSFSGYTNGRGAAVTFTYSAVYDPSTNKTKVTITNYTAVFNTGGATGYCQLAGTLTVKAADNTGSAGTLNVSASKSNANSPTVSTDVSQVIEVSHGTGTSKQITLAFSGTINSVTYFSYPDESTTVQVYTAVAYKLTLSSNGTDLTAKLKASFFRSAGAALTNGATIYGWETVEITFSAAAGYQDPVCTVGGVGNISSGDSFTVKGNCTVTSSATKIPYTLKYSVGNGAALTVTRSGSALASGDTIYYSDSLNISFSAQTGYEIKSAVLNGGEITSPYTHKVTGNVDLTVVTALLSSAWICINGVFKRYFINIFIQGAWRKCREKIFSGGGTEQQAICGQALCGTIKCGGDT